MFYIEEVNIPSKKREIKIYINEMIDISKLPQEELDMIAKKLELVISQLLLEDNNE